MGSDTSFEIIFERLLQVTGATTDSNLAKLLQIKPQSVAAAKKRRQLPPGWVVTVAQSFGVTTDWLFFGKGPVRRDDRQPPAEAAARKGADTLAIKNLQRVLAERDLRIRELEQQLAQTKEEALTVYRRAFNAMCPPTDCAHGPPHYKEPSFSSPKEKNLKKNK
jgi:Bacteriophage CI repressor helix-turn-helix domain.